MYSFTFFKQNVCTVNVHEMFYKFNPASQGVIGNCSHGLLWQREPRSFHDNRREGLYEPMRQREPRSFHDNRREGLFEPLRQREPRSFHDSRREGLYEPMRQREPRSFHDNRREGLFPTFWPFSLETPSLSMYM
jgi:hypothetical protein